MMTRASILMLMSVSCFAGVPTTQPAPMIIAGTENVIPDGHYRHFQLSPAVNGTAEKPTIIRAANRWKATIVPGPTNGVFALEGEMIKHVVIDGIEITGGDWDGIRFYLSESVTIRNCWIHGCKNHGILMGSAKKVVVENCILEDNGNPLQSGHLRHALYAAGEDITVRGNVIRNNSGSGIHLWETATRCLIERNTITGHANGSAIVLQRPLGASGLKVEDANIIRENLLLDNQAGIRLYRVFGEKIDRNVIVGGITVYVATAKGPITLTGNSLQGATRGLTNYVKVLER